MAEFQWMWSNSTADAWHLWNQDLTSTSTNTVTLNTPIVWNTWTIQLNPNWAFVEAQRGQAARRSPEAQAEDARLAEEARRAYAATLAEQAQVEARAEQLLLAHLTPAQQQEYRREHRITLHVRGRARYRICRGTSGNVEHLARSGRVKAHLCAYVPGVPMGDHLLAQKLLLETNEPEFLRVANRTAA